MIQPLDDTPEGSPPARAAGVEDYSELYQQVERESERWLASARKVLGFLVPAFRPHSLLDVGCGLGLWLKAAIELGVTDLLGIDGDWVDPARLAVPPSYFVRADLERPFSLGRRFDLALCLEVAEHLKPESAAGLVDSLTAHAPLVLFSAAIPLQGGPGHVNEQWPDWWAAQFAARDFVTLDVVRPKFWLDYGLQPWYRQNLILFADRRRIDGDAGLMYEARAHRPLSIVHPSLYLSYTQRMLKLQADRAAMAETFGDGGVFQITRRPDGSFEARRL